MSAVRAFAPGRVNLIGEHTDYNDGLCLPFAIALGVSVTAMPLAGRERGIEAAALDFGEEDRFDLPAGPASTGAARPVSPAGWRCFVRGAAFELVRDGIELRPCRLEIGGDLPREAGLASSAALCVSLCLALCAASGSRPPAPTRMARLCSRVENEWCGARTGLLDQLASLRGEPGRALLLDMRTLVSRPVELTLERHRLVSLASGASRALAGSGYNERREECRRAAAALGVASLRDAMPSEGDLTRLPEPLGRRARHVLTENGRVEETVSALRNRDLERVGALLDASHRSLRDDFDVSVPEVEEAVVACKEAGALGARIIGGGFGGSVLALFAPGATVPAGGVEVRPSAGARLL